VLIHGRRDISSPAAIPWDLQRRWHGSTLRIDEGNGHGGTSMAKSWRIANDALTTRFQR
jgi:proline iminopeptidase